jgi:VWFA-related protein
MRRHAGVVLLAGALSFPSAAQQPVEAKDVVFRSGVALVRVDVHVLRGGRPVTGLHAEDFVLLENAHPVEIRSFAREEMPLDVLLLLDVSGSMRPHVESVAAASRQALRVLAKDDRVAVMVFDQFTRLRMSFRSSRGDVERELDRVVNQESFGGGTDVTGALLDAANFMRLHARDGARRAIVAVTDDQTELQRDDTRVLRALERADAALSALIAPDVMESAGGGGRRSRGAGYPGGNWPGGRVGFPGGVGLPGGIGFPGGGGGGGGVILGPGSPLPRGGGRRTRPAGTAEIAVRSGGDSLPVDEADALQTTLERFRQRYALFFNAPEDTGGGGARRIEVHLSAEAASRYKDAELRFRRSYLPQAAPLPQAALGVEISAAPAAGEVIAYDASGGEQTGRQSAGAKSPGAEDGASYEAVVGEPSRAPMDVDGEASSVTESGAGPEKSTPPRARRAISEPSPSRGPLVP